MIHRDAMNIAISRFSDKNERERWAKREREKRRETSYHLK